MKSDKTGLSQSGKKDPIKAMKKREASITKDGVR